MHKNMKSTFSFSGLTTYFDVGDHVIEVFLSSISGREVVRVDGQEVSSRRNWRYRSSHAFELDGARYRVEVTIISLLKGQARIDLYKDDAYLDHDEIDWKQAFAGGQAKPSRLQSTLVILGLMLAGGVCGYLAAKLVGQLFG